MIGVFAGDADLEMAGELFELFKTPWEVAVGGRAYEAVLSTSDRVDHLETRLLLLFGPEANSVDRVACASVRIAASAEVQWDQWRFPLFGPAAFFQTTRPGTLSVRGAALDYRAVDGPRCIHRVGYNVFGEIRHLLTVGQPAAYATVPTLEIHISILRSWLIRARVPFLEVLPRPAAHPFICCLTHDVDYMGLRRHGLDHTVLGFVFRASVGTALDVIRGRRPMNDLLKNVAALGRLPWILLGLSRELWHPFEDYRAFEDPAHSTFYLVPFKNRAGRGPDGRIHRKRAVRYQLSEVAEDVLAAVERGSEVGIHGIDAWRDDADGAAELEQLTAVVPGAPGVRMHWLYDSPDSPRHLEAAGFAYDSTWGYNESVGYRAGTTQAFRLPASRELLELPLSIMDSALLSSERKGLSQKEALEHCRQILADVQRFGGTLVVNWHCRSLAPERLWDGAYRTLLEDINRDGQAWCTTARSAVEWFRWRRGTKLLEYQSDGTTFVRVSAPHRPAQPALLRVHRMDSAEPTTCDVVFDGSAPKEVPLTRLCHAS